MTTPLQNPHVFQPAQGPPTIPLGVICMANFMIHKVSGPGTQIQGKRGVGCESVNDASPTSITGVVEGEYLMVYENKPSYKLIIQSGGVRFRVSGYDDVREGKLLRLLQKQVAKNWEGFYPSLFFKIKSEETWG